MAGDDPGVAEVLRIATRGSDGLADYGSEGVSITRAPPDPAADVTGRPPAPERSGLLELAFYALRETRTPEELLDQAACITTAAMGGDLVKVLEHVPPVAPDFLAMVSTG